MIATRTVCRPYRGRPPVAIAVCFDNNATSGKETRGERERANGIGILRRLIPDDTWSIPFCIIHGRENDRSSFFLVIVQFEVRVDVSFSFYGESCGRFRCISECLVIYKRMPDNSEAEFSNASFGFNILWNSVLYFARVALKNFRNNIRYFQRDIL